MRNFMKDCMERIKDTMMDIIFIAIKEFIEVIKICCDIIVKVLIAPFAIVALMLILLVFFKNEE